MSISKFLKWNNLFSNQKFKYLLIGFYNTIFGYLIFVLFFYYFAEIVNHSLLLGICHLIGATNNFFSYKTFVFKIRDSNLKNYIRFNLVYLFIYIINLVIFLTLTKILNWNIYLSQGLIVILIAILGYILNKNYSFSNKLILAQEEK
jgi:putative flippase GtrA